MKQPLDIRSSAKIGRAVSAIVVIGMLGVMTLAGCGNAPTAMVSGDSDDESPKALVRLPLELLSDGFARRHEFDRESLIDDRWAFGWINRADMRMMSPSVLDQLTMVDAATFRHHQIDPDTLEVMDAFVARDGEAREPFHDNAALEAEFRKLADAYPKLTAMSSIGKSVKGLNVWMLKIGRDAAQETGAPKLLYVGNIHGDETTGREMLIYLARLLLDSYGKDQRLTALVDNAQIYLVPGSNPDGYNQRRRYNADYVDLNRSFPDFTSDPNDSSTGRAVEVGNLMALHDAHHFQLAANFHGGAVCVNIPWDTKSNSGNGRFEDDEMMFPWATEYARSNSEMVSQNSGSFKNGVTYGYEWYEVDGGFQDWATYYRRSIHATIELSSVKWPSESSLPGFWDRNRESLIRYAEHVLDGVHLRVLDGRGATIAPVTVSIAGLRDQRFDTNIVHRLALPGPVDITVSAPGYKSRVVRVESRRFDGDYYLVSLDRN